RRAAGPRSRGLGASWGYRAMDRRHDRPRVSTRRERMAEWPMQLVPFLAVALLVVLTPGADMALVTKNALLYGRPAAIATALGVNAGVAVWALATALGLAAVVRSSPALFNA